MAGGLRSYEAEYIAGELKASRTYLAPGVLHNGAGPQVGLSFMHQDRLGSALVITDNVGGILNSSGTQAEFRTFDAFGKARDNKGLDTLSGNLFAGSPNEKRNRKGFTGHEHLDEAGLIHMNGRTYDYNLGRFYGVDPIIQFPTNSQSLNGYSYLMNNPLSGTDPTGYCSTPTGTKICNFDTNGSTKALSNAGIALRGRITEQLKNGGSVIIEPRPPREARQIKAFAANNGYSVSQPTSQQGQTDGSTGTGGGFGGGSSKIGNSNKNKEINKRDYLKNIEKIWKGGELIENEFTTNKQVEESKESTNALEAVTSGDIQSNSDQRRFVLAIANQTAKAQINVMREKFISANYSNGEFMIDRTVWLGPNGGLIPNVQGDLVVHWHTLRGSRAPGPGDHSPTKARGITSFVVTYDMKGGCCTVYEVGRIGNKYGYREIESVKRVGGWEYPNNWNGK